MTALPVRSLLLLVLAFLALAGGPAAAQSVKLLGEYRAWSAYSATESTGPVCFALTKPSDVSPTPDGYTEAYLYLTHRPAEGVRNEMNLVAGYTFAPDTPATVTVSGQSFELFTENDAAWLRDPGQNDNLAGALRAGSTVVVEGTSDRGIRITETFSLSGATAASRAIEGDCTG
ncbi:invasion associated locus B family protein [Devosia sp.]|uniref:invasion associated locus B family protein n=1 Tax=Devosia sp. TaxID=1871048 RepID=UPI0035B35A14